MESLASFLPALRQRRRGDQPSQGVGGGQQPSSSYTLRCLRCVCLVRPKYLAACRMLGIAWHAPHYSQLLIGLLHARTLHARAHRCFRGDESQASRLGLLYRQPMSLSHTRLSRTRQAKLGLGLNYLDFDSSVSPDCTASQSAPRRKQAMSRDKESAAQGLLVLTLLLFWRLTLISSHSNAASVLCLCWILTIL